MSCSANKQCVCSYAPSKVVSHSVMRVSSGGTSSPSMTPLGMQSTIKAPSSLKTSNSSTDARVNTHFDHFSVTPVRCKTQRKIQLVQFAEHRGQASLARLAAYPVS
eukprot:3948549-Pleurochrysis_carterae.AAC.1